MTKDNSYKSTLEFLYSQLPMYQRQGKSAFKKDLTNIKNLARFIENPHNSFRSIHVAGTNGKGTVSHLLASILQEHGLKVGLYTSPHYKDFRERIKVNGGLMPKQAVVDFVEKVKPKLGEIPASFFELTVALAFQYFKEEEVDIAIIETGLGGRLDSTNIITPLLSVITNISLDHTDMLGDTIPVIAAEKAGIIKHEVPVLIGEKQALTTEVYLMKAKEEKSDLVFAEDIVSENKVDEFVTYDDLNPFFARNVRTALAAVQMLETAVGQHWHKEKILRGIERVRENTYYIGRWEVLSQEPITVVDSAHNVAGLEQVIRRLEGINYEKAHFVLGFVKEKKVDEILDLFPKEAQYYFVKADIPRGLAASTLSEKGKALGLVGNSYSSVASGMQAAKRNAGKGDLVYAGGSIFVVAEVI